MSKIYIVGAHSRGITIGHYLKYLNPELEIIAYLYDNDEENPTEIDGVPVVRLNEKTELDVETPVYLGIRGVSHAHFIDILLSYGMKRIIPVDVRFDLVIRNQFLKKYYTSMGRTFQKIEELLSVPSSFFMKKQSACVYVACSAFDKGIQNKYILQDYEAVLQVGVELTDKHINAEYYDNEGEHISDKNAQFCELTGLYWIWKNATQDVVGLVHYRRHFIIPKDWLFRMEYYNIDVILPIPLYVGPNIEENYRSRHIALDWDYMMEYLKENCSEDYELASKFFKETSLYSPCNMFIMRKEILDDLCNWLFPILFAVAGHGGIKEDKYQNRYPGFISERLITFFFEKNCTKYKIIYADKNFLS